MFTLNIHSIVDVITNSSTVIYTWQDSIKEARELLQEILALSGETTPVDDLFWFGVFLDDNDYYYDRISDMEEEDRPEGYPLSGYSEQEKFIEDFKIKIMKGELEKPGWMVEFESNDGDDFDPSRSLHLIPKESKYRPLVKAMIAFLNSPNCDGDYNG